MLEEAVCRWRCRLLSVSTQGNDLGADRTLLERLWDQDFGQFIKDELGFTILATGEHRNILYVARDAEAAPRSALPRYNRSFWAAFVIPLKDGERRFINLDTQRFSYDETSFREAGGEVREMTADYVAQPGAVRDAQHIAEQIQRWLTDQGLDPAPFLIDERHAVRSAHPTALDVLLRALDSEQLRRVSLPLDIVQALKARAR